MRTGGMGISVYRRSLSPVAQPEPLRPVFPASGYRCSCPSGNIFPTGEYATPPVAVAVVLPATVVLRGAETNSRRKDRSDCQCIVMTC
jgi:hypothetical protein